jgi:hypothetical protein
MHRHLPSSLLGRARAPQVHKLGVLAFQGIKFAAHWRWRGEETRVGMCVPPNLVEEADAWSQPGDPNSIPR